MLRRFFRDRRGVTAVEMAVLAPMIFVAVLSSIDLGLFVWRWNEAVQAARLGARLAAVSDPVASELSNKTGLETGVAAGQPAAAYEHVCQASAATCSGASYSATAMGHIISGPGSSACGDATELHVRGMCDVFPLLEARDVTVIYRQSGIDAAGTAGALRPLITVRIQGAGPRLVLFDRILPLALPTTEATTLAEDLRSGA